MTMRLHLVNLPHTETIKTYSWCAYTQKVRRFADMMSGLGHDVFLYAGEDNEAACAEHVVCLSQEERAALFTEPIPPFDPASPGWRTFNARAAGAIEARAKPEDYLCLIAGTAQQPVAVAVNHLRTVEFGVGYGGVFSDFRVFESYAWMHTVYGARSGGDSHGIDGRFFDTVIPNSFEVDDFPAGDGAGGYLLYMGRLTERKGLAVVRDIAARTGLPLIIAGDGNTDLIPPGAEYVGVVGPERRAELMGGAVALLAPTLYVEPFGGVAVEAQLCGTPVIATPWGAFTETVDHGRTGFLCHTLAQFCDAVDQAPALHRMSIRVRAISRYSTGVIAPQYQAYFDRLELLNGDGWYTAATA